MKLSKKFITKTAGILITLFFILPAIGFSVLNWGVLPPEKLTPLVIDQTNKFLNAHLECERIELTYFETYPYLGIKLINGQLISHAAEDSTAHEEELIIPSDSLLTFSKVTVSMQPLDYLFGGKITIKDFSLENPRFYGFVNKEGRANWEIYQSETDSLSDTDSKETLPPIDLQKVHISGGHFTYDDHQKELFAEIRGFFLTLEGSLAQGENTLKVETGTSSTLFRSPTYTLTNDLSIKLKSLLLLSDNYNSVKLQNAELLVNNLPFTARGSIVNHPEQVGTQIDMEMGMKISDMNDLLKFIPNAYFQNREKIQATGSILVEGSIHGMLGDSIVPNVSLCCKIDKGSYHIKGIKQGIDTLQMDLDLHLNGAFPDSSYISMEQLTMKGLNTSIDMQGKVSNLLQNPAIETRMKGQIDFTRLAKEFLNPDTLLIEGIINANFSAAFTVNDLLESQYGKVKASGQLNIDQLKAYSQAFGMDIYIGSAHFGVDSLRGTNDYLGKKDLLNLSLSVDSLNVKYKDEVSTNISRLQIKGQTSPTIDTAAVIPMTMHLQFDRLLTRLPDSVWLVAGKTSLKGGIKASVSDKRIPQAGATVSVDTLKYFITSMRTGVILAESTFNLETLPYRDARRQLQQTLPASAKARGARRTTMPAQIQTDTTSTTGKLLRQWEVRGNVHFKQMRAFSRLFPLPIHLEPTTVKFNTNDVTLTDARLHLGKSNFTLNGEIKRIRQAMLRGGKLRGNFSVTSDYIDCNQLMQATNSGMLYAEQHPSATDMTMGDTNIAQMETNVLLDSVVSTNADQLFILPGYLDMTLQTQVKRIDFKELQLENVNGEVILRNQSIKLNDLNMHSNIGCGNLSMIYTAKDKSGASSGFDLDMEDVQVEKLIGLVPSIDTLIPMLRSFEGVLDCEVTATCNIDSSMSIIMPSLHSACYLHGKNMVLLDGETFTEISKTLMFKNKMRNVIDSISVDLSVQDNKIEVYPFLLQMDRYKVAVGGTHNLDMTFSYHLSVLKSPVPFKLGIDVTGNLDDFKYKVVKCRYKDLFKPAKTGELENTQTNIRIAIRDAIRKQIEKAAPELTSSLEVSHSHTHEQGEKGAL